MDDREGILGTLGAAFRVAVDADESDGVRDCMCASVPRRCISRDTSLWS